MTSGRLIQKTREKKHMSRDTLLLNLSSRGYIMSMSKNRRIESDQHRKCINDLVAIADVLNIHFEAILSCEDISNPA